MGDIPETVQTFIDKQPVYDRRRRVMLPILRGIVNTLCNVTINGLEHIPKSGPTLLISNHLSFYDPGIVTAVPQNRYVISMSKIEAIRNPVIRFVVALWGNYYIRRGTVDRQALTNSIELIKSGQMVWIAPEGTRNPDGLGEPKDGIAYIASKANATLVPMSIIGIGNLHHQMRRLSRTSVEVNLGEAFRFKIPAGKRLRNVRSQMVHEAMYRIAHTIPDDHAPLRGLFADLDNATTETLDFLTSSETTSQQPKYTASNLSPS